MRRTCNQYPAIMAMFSSAVDFLNAKTKSNGIEDNTEEEKTAVHKNCISGEQFRGEASCSNLIKIDMNFCKIFISMKVGQDYFPLCFIYKDAILIARSTEI